MQDMEYTTYAALGLKVLAVDVDTISLRRLEFLLTECHYDVTTTSEASIALKMVRENKDNFDIVICSLNMPDMDESILLDILELKPVIVMSTHLDWKLLLKWLKHGACEYLRTPITLLKLKNIWMHVVKRNPGKDASDKGKGVARHAYERLDESMFLQIWTSELHHKFVQAVNHLDPQKAVPEDILKLMNVEKLTVENVAIHLQKYRYYLEKQPGHMLEDAAMILADGSCINNVNLHNTNDSCSNDVNLHNMHDSVDFPKFSTVEDLGGCSPSGIGFLGDYYFPLSGSCGYRV